jgi:hypothetical protein
MASYFFYSIKLREYLKNRVLLILLWLGFHLLGFLTKSLQQIATLVRLFDQRLKGAAFRSVASVEISGKTLILGSVSG